MLFKFQARRFLMVDGEDRALGQMVKWCQELDGAIDDVWDVLRIIGVSAIGSLAVAANAAPPADDYMGYLACALVAVGIGLLIIGRSLCTERCEAHFYGDGTLRMPRGALMNLIRGPYVLCDHSDIDQIQSQQTEVLGRPDPNRPKRHEVWVYLHSGYSFSIAENLLRHEAHQVAVMLEQALTDMRQDASESSLRGVENWAELAID